MTIYTKTGDSGVTGLPGGRRLSKSAPIFEVLGTLDSANATVGVAISFMNPEQDEAFIDQLQGIQAIFLGIGACIASADDHQFDLLKQLPRHTIELEEQIDHWEQQLPELTNFILPGGSHAGSALHLARTKIRDAERAYLTLTEQERFAEISIYLNRLADYFFQAARYYNHFYNTPEIRWLA